ncbi:MAG: DNA polymerase domain-containing protein [Kiritimatiellae bacterium]|nr:DNA polymerase domain-containing protein [Kiritimatiellia bacterium]
MNSSNPHSEQDNARPSNRQPAPPEKATGNPLIGRDATPGLLAIVWRENPKQDEMLVYTRPNQKTLSHTEPFHPFFLLKNPADLDGFEEPFELHPLSGEAPLNNLILFPTWKSLQRALKHIKNKQAVHLVITDPVQQHLLLTGKALFKEMPFTALRRMQIDIETYTEPGFEFCNAQRDGDRITAIAMADSSGWTHLLDGSKLSEKELLQNMVDLIRERDPDVIEGHNLFNFDLPYLVTRAKKQRVKLAIGRDGSIPKSRSSRLSIGERIVSYTRMDIHGRHLIDTYFLVQLYDITSRSLESFSLKNAAIHFGVAAPDRTYLNGADIARLFHEDPARLMRYAQDDILETRSLATILSPVYFAQAQMLPYTYQNVCVRGNAVKIDALLLREYLHQRCSVPLPGPARPFAGGYTDLFFEGVALHVHHCDVRSLYPSLMLKDHLEPASDSLHVFLDMLKQLRDLRLELKDRMRLSNHPEERLLLDARQSCLKILINSFYGYLGFAQGHFNDFDAAERITANGRDLLKEMIRLIKTLGGRPVEIDTDGVYFVPPSIQADEVRAFRQTFAEQLPAGIDVEFDGEYRSMYSYKMKNYALLDEHGGILVKGAALKSRGLEPFQRRYIHEFLRLKLEQRDQDIPALQQEFEDAIRLRKWPITMLAKTEVLQADPSNYAAKIQAGNRGRNAAYELALASNRTYRAGDQLSYYVTGDRKSVAVYAAAKPVSEWDPQNRDENIVYYLDKLHALFRKFGEESRQGMLF